MPDWLKCEVGGITEGKFLPRIIIDQLSQEELSKCLPSLLAASNGGETPQFDRKDKCPQWWPDDIPWTTPRPGVGPSAECLRGLIRSLYTHHGLSDLILSSQHTDHYSAVPAMTINLVTNGQRSSDALRRYTNLQPLQFNSASNVAVSRKRAGDMSVSSNTYTCYFCEKAFPSTSAVVKHLQQCSLRPSTLQCQYPLPGKSSDDLDDLESQSVALPIPQIRVPKIKFLRQIGIVPLQKAELIRTRIARESIDLDCEIIAVIPPTTPVRATTPGTPLSSSSLMSQLKRKNSSTDDIIDFTAADNHRDNPCDETELAPVGLHPVSLSIIDLTSPLGMRLHKQMAITSPTFYIVNKPETYCKTPVKNDALEKLRIRSNIFQTTFKMTSKMRRQHCHEICLNSCQRREKSLRLKTGLSRKSRMLARVVKPCSVALKRLSVHRFNDLYILRPFISLTPVDISECTFPCESILACPGVDVLLGLNYQQTVRSSKMPSVSSFSPELNAELAKFKLVVYRSLLKDHSLLYRMEDSESGDTAVNPGHPNLVRRLIKSSTVLHKGIKSDLSRAQNFAASTKSSPAPSRSLAGSEQSPFELSVGLLQGSSSVNKCDHRKPIENDRDVFIGATGKRETKKSCKMRNYEVITLDDASIDHRRNTESIPTSDVQKLQTDGSSSINHRDSDPFRTNDSSSDRSGNDQPGNDHPSNDRSSNDQPGNDRPSNDHSGNDRSDNGGLGNHRPGNDQPGNDRPSYVRHGIVRSSNGRFVSSNASANKICDTKTNDDSKLKCSLLSGSKKQNHSKCSTSKGSSDSRESRSYTSSASKLLKRERRLLNIDMTLPYSYTDLQDRNRKRSSKEQAKRRVSHIIYSQRRRSVVDGLGNSDEVTVSAPESDNSDKLISGSHSDVCDGEMSGDATRDEATMTEAASHDRINKVSPQNLHKSPGPITKINNTLVVPEPKTNSDIQSTPTKQNHNSSIINVADKGNVTLKFNNHNRPKRKLVFDSSEGHMSVKRKHDGQEDTEVTWRHATASRDRVTPKHRTTPQDSVVVVDSCGQKSGIKRNVATGIVYRGPDYSIKVVGHDSNGGKDSKKKGMPNVRRYQHYNRDPKRCTDWQLYSTSQGDSEQRGQSIFKNHRESDRRKAALIQQAGATVNHRRFSDWASLDQSKKEKVGTRARSVSAELSVGNKRRRPVASTRIGFVGQSSVNHTAQNSEVAASDTVVPGDHGPTNLSNKLSHRYKTTKSLTQLGSSTDPICID